MTTEAAATTAAEAITATAIKEFELINVDINDIELDPSNPNVMTKEQMSAMRKSMQQYGYLVPVILDRNNKICDGEHRVLVYKELGLSTIPAYRVDLDSDTDRKQLRQIMNKLHGQHDRSKDADEFLEILQNSRDGTLKQLSELIAQPQEQLLSLIKYYHPEIDVGLEQQSLTAAEQRQAQIIQRAQIDDVWQLGNDSRVYCGDNVSVLKSMVPNNCIDLTVTSPPYDAARVYKGYTFNFEPLAEELYRVTKEGGVVVWVVNDMSENGSETLTSFNQAIYFKKIGFRVHDTMIWKKKGAPMPSSGKRYYGVFEYMFVFSKGEPNTFNPIEDSMNTGAGSVQQVARRQPDGSQDLMPPYIIKDFSKRGNVWDISTAPTNGKADMIAYEHPAVFPEVLAADHIKTWTNKGDLVLDPFSGSGTTIMASSSYTLGRKSIGIDISPEYIDILLQRWQNLTNEEPVKQEQAPEQ